MIKNKINKQYCYYLNTKSDSISNSRGFFSYISLIIGTILILFWSALSDEMNIIVGIVHDEVALTSMNYKAEGAIGCILREYSERGSLMPVQQEVEYEKEGNNTVTYILNRPGKYNDMGNFRVHYRNSITGQQVSYLVQFSETSEVWPKSIRVERVSRLQ